MTFRALTKQGIEQFGAWIEKGARRKPPIRLLTDDGFSEAFRRVLSVNEVPPFRNRYEMGLYLVRLFREVPDAVLEGHRGVWAALSLLWFESLCPKAPGGRRQPGAVYAWIPSSDWRHAHRHLVKPCWQLVRTFRADARLMLLASSQVRDSLSRRGEVFEQLASRLGVLANPWVLAWAVRTYADPDTGRPRRGAAGKGPGTVRRMGVVFSQLELTHDLPSVPAHQIPDLLPSEFDRWMRSGK